MGKPDPRPQPMPTDRAILWNPSLPGAKPQGRAPYPIFFQQEAVIALQEHLKSSPTQAIFGFLIGGVFRDPESGVMYVVIDKTLKLSQPIYGDKTDVVVARLWDRMQEQLAKAAGTLLGWYHSHPGQGGYLTPHDVETHEKFFTDPWQVAILVAAEAGGVTGRFFRTQQSADWHKVPLAFYELLQPDSIKPDGKKRSFILWRNYKAYGPSLKGPPPPKPAPPPLPPSPPPPPPPPPKARVEEGPEDVEDVEAVEEDEEEVVEEKPEERLRIMRGSADDIPVIRTSADDEPAPAPRPMAPPPPPRHSAKRPAAPVFIPDEPPVPPAPPPPPPPAPPPPAPRSARGSAPDIPWQVAPEDLPPPPMPPPAPLPPPPLTAPRRTSSPKFRLLEEPEAKPAPAKKSKRRGRRRGWLGKAAMILLLAGIGAGAYWYFVMRDPGAPPPWAGLVDRVKRLVSGGSSTPPAAARPGTGARRGGTRAAPPAAPAQPPPPRPPPAPPNPFARIDRLSADLSRAVRNFNDRAALFATGSIDCTALANGLIAMENLWITYNTERRARIASFDAQRAANDQALYARVDSVESRFEASGCRRP
jgi:proteasome lid subunit RPN8/RPN11